MKFDEGLRIGELAERAGIATSAIRYYEQMGLIAPPERASGHRRYREDAVDRLRLIGVLRSAELGIRDLQVALDRSPEAMADRQRAAKQRAEELRQQLHDVQRALAVLDHAGECTSTSDDDAACAADIQRRLDEMTGGGRTRRTRVRGGGRAPVGR